MKRIMLKVAYDGTNYHGWQYQPGALSIEEVLNGCLTDLVKEPVQIIGASRTDAGVHSLGTIAVFDTQARMPGDKYSYALNQRLPEDIRVRESKEVAVSFHPRKSPSVKTYEYCILNEEFPNPVRRLYSHFTYLPLDVNKMQEAAAFLEGEHDFKSFCSIRTQAETTVRTIHSIRVERIGEEIHIRVSGSGFLYNMIRIIAGTLMEIGNGKYPPQHMRTILEALDRQTAGPTAPANGLTLIGYEYQGGIPETTADRRPPATTFFHGQHSIYADLFEQ